MMELTVVVLLAVDALLVRYIVRRERAGKPLWMEKTAATPPVDNREEKDFLYGDEKKWSPETEVREG